MKYLSFFLIGIIYLTLSSNKPSNSNQIGIKKRIKNGLVNSFVLLANQGATVHVDFIANEEVAIELLHSGTYQPNVDDRIKKRIHWWNSTVGSRQDFTITKQPLSSSYDIVGSFKPRNAPTGHDPFHDFDFYESQAIKNPDGSIAGYKIIGKIKSDPKVLSTSFRAAEITINLIN